MAKKFKQCSNDVDRLSSLPYDILVQGILSLLPMRDVARTSVLSRRWRSLWSRVPCLDFACPTKIVPFPRDCTNPVAFTRFKELDQEAASDYADWVDHVFRSYGGSTPLRSFRILFRMGDSFRDRINFWLARCFLKGVQALELSCSELHICRNPPFRFLKFPPHLCPRIRLLKSLTLEGVAITDDSLEHLFSVCELLESLQLRFLTLLTQVKVTGPVSRLKSIAVRGCLDLRSIHIKSPTPDLVSFQPDEQITDDVHIEYAPRLADLAMTLVTGIFNLVSHPLFGYISQLEALHLHIWSWHTAVDWLPDLPDLSRLKHLRLGLEYRLSRDSDRSLLGRQLHCLGLLIKALPSLQHLTLEMAGLDPKLKIEDEFANLQLPRVIEIVGFRGRRLDREVALHLIKAAVSLEKLIIDCRDPSLRGSEHGAYPCSEKTIHKWKRSAKRLIEPELPSKAKLVLI